MSTATLPRYAELTPSYGREFNNAPAVKLAFAQGKDFTFAATGQQTSIRDAAVGTPVQLRYKNNTRVAMFTVEAKHLAALNGGQA